MMEVIFICAALQSFDDDNGNAVMTEAYRIEDLQIEKWVHTVLGKRVIVLRDDEKVCFLRIGDSDNE